MVYTYSASVKHAPGFSVIGVEDAPEGWILMFTVRVTAENPMPPVPLPEVTATTSRGDKLRILGSGGWQVGETWTGKLLLAPRLSGQATIVIHGFTTDRNLTDRQLKKIGETRGRLAGPWEVKVSRVGPVSTGD